MRIKRGVGTGVLQERDKGPEVVSMIAGLDRQHGKVFFSRVAPFFGLSR